MVGKTPETPNPDLTQFVHSLQDADTDFDYFAQRPRYRVETLELIALTHRWVPDDRVSVDLASGTGLYAQLDGPLTLAARRRAVVFCIDADPHATEKGRRQTPSSDDYRVIFIQGLAQDMKELLKGKTPEDGVDMVSIIHALHEISKRLRADVVQASADILKPRGILAVNSFFTSIAIQGHELEWTLPIYKAAIRHGGKKSNNPGFVGEPPEYYDQLFLNAGLKPVHYSTSEVTFSSQDMVDFNRYAGWVDGARSMFDFDEGTPSTRDFSASLMQQFARSGPKTRTCVRWICQKP